MELQYEMKHGQYRIQPELLLLVPLILDNQPITYVIPILAPVPAVRTVQSTPTRLPSLTAINTLVMSRNGEPRGTRPYGQYCLTLLELLR